MSTTDQRICLWLVPAFAAFLLVAFLMFPGFLPPMSPNMTAEAVAGFYRDHVGAIRASMVIVNVCGIGFIPFFMVIVVQMQRMGSHAFAYSYLSAAASGATLLALADLAWLIAAFRPERDPQLTQLLNDFGWIAFVTPVGFVIAQNLCLALAILTDPRRTAVFPRWVAHFNIVAALLMSPGALAMMFTDGPFAWDGLLAFWVRIGAYCLYLAVMFFVVRTAVEQQAGEEAGVA